jgi:hypothetical protein
MGMGISSDPSDNPSDPSERERRQQKRICGPFPVTIRSVDASGEAFEIHTVLKDFSSSSFRVRLERHVERGAKVFAIVRRDGTWRVTVNFTRHRFL